MCKADGGGQSPPPVLESSGSLARREAAKILAQHYQEREMFAAAAFKDLSQQLLKLTFAMNGGAIVAILTFIGAVAKTGDGITVAEFLNPLLVFALGLVSSAIATISAFYNYRVNFWENHGKTIHFSKVVGSDSQAMWNGGDPPPTSRRRRLLIQVSRWSAEGGWYCSVISFAAGAYLLYVKVNEVG